MIIVNLTMTIIPNSIHTTAMNKQNGSVIHFGKMDIISNMDFPLLILNTNQMRTRLVFTIKEIMISPIQPLVPNDSATSRGKENNVTPDWIK
jgi:hypothetical protein